MGSPARDPSVSPTGLPTPGASVVGDVFWSSPKPSGPTHDRPLESGAKLPTVASQVSVCVAVCWLVFVTSPVPSLHGTLARNGGRAMTGRHGTQR